jgi:cobalt-precorrin 5A hydrolase
MSDTVVISFPRFKGRAARVAGLLGADLVTYSPDAFPDAFAQHRRIVAIMSLGIAVRQIAPLLRDKWTDPAVVVVSPDLSFAVPVIGGHHGANALARSLAPLGIVPVVTTATEAVGREPVEAVAERTGRIIANPLSTKEVNAAILDGEVPVVPVPGPAIVLAGTGVSFLVRGGEYAVGLGCRKGVSAGEVAGAIRGVLAGAGIEPGDVMVYSTTEKKVGETGLLLGVRELGGGILYLPDRVINAQEGTGPSAASRIGLSGEAEPCALAVSRRRELVVPKKVCGRVTVAVAR